MRLCHHRKEAVITEQLSLNILIPGINGEHNFLVPEEMSVDHAVGLIVRTLSEEYPSVGSAALKGYRLLRRASGQILDPSCSFRQLGILQGENLILM